MVVVSFRSKCWRMVSCMIDLIMRITKAFPLLCAVFAAGVVLTSGNDDFTVDEENVLILTEDDFQQALKKFKYLFVDFRTYDRTLDVVFIRYADIRRLSAFSR